MLLPENTLVWLADGRRVPIAELVGQQPWVHAVGSNQKLVQAQSDLVLPETTAEMLTRGPGADRARVMSFSRSAVRRVHDLSPGLATVLLMDPVPKRMRTGQLPAGVPIVPVATLTEAIAAIDGWAAAKG